MIRFISLILISSFCLAQTNTSSLPARKLAVQTFVLGKIHVSGSKRFSEAEIIKALGLKPGARVTGDDLRQAASTLAQWGVFKDVRFTFDGVTADYDVVDADTMVPAVFENFVWFSDTELGQGVRKSVPLFNGNVPLSGNMVEQVNAALDSILKQKGIAGHAASMMQSTLSGQLQSVQFRVEGVDVKVAEVRFPGAAADRVPMLQGTVKIMIGEDYLYTTAVETVRRNAPIVYGKLGFLKARFGNARPVILKDEAGQVVVAVEVPVEEGDQYTFAAVNWSGSGVIPSDELAKSINLKAGGIADTTELARGIAFVKERFGTKGYLSAQLRSTATLDTEKHTAIFNVDISEGPLYRMGKFEVQGLDPERTQLVQKIWELHEGDIYDSSYPPSFLKKHPRELTALDGWRSNFRQTIHDDTHVVDLRLKFEKFQREAR